MPPCGPGREGRTVSGDGTAEGRIIDGSSFMQARSQAEVPIAGDLSARTAYADSERASQVTPLLLEDWMPALLAQLTVPGAHFTRATSLEGTRLLHLFDPDRESFASFTENEGTWTVRQGGPVALWDSIEQALTAWLDAGSPGITAVRLRITRETHIYWIDGHPALQWQHRLLWRGTHRALDTPAAPGVQGRRPADRGRPRSHRCHEAAASRAAS